MKSFSFKAKMLSLMILIIIVFIIQGILVHDATNTSHQIIKNIYEESVISLEEIAKINNELLTDVQIPVESLRTNGITDPSVVYGIKTKIKEIKNNFAAFQSKTAKLVNEQNILSKMALSLNNIESSFDKIAQQKNYTIKNKELSHWNNLFDSFNNSLSQYAHYAKEFSTLNAQKDAAIIDKLQKRLDNKTKLSIWVTIISLLIVIILPTLFIKDITRKYLLVIKYLTNLSKGNLTDEIPDISHDEMGWILHNVKKLQTSLRKITIEVNTAAGNLSIASHDLSASSQSIAQGASEQASSVEEISSSIEQLASNIHQVSDNAKATETISNKLAEMTDLMVAEANKSQEKMNAIAEKVGIINEIAFQTNILALNAAVEAARAGEQGRGFGVVAVEVGKLAERSKKAAAEIEDLIHSSVEVIEKAGKMMVEAAPEVNKTAEMVRGIAQASMEQKLGADQMNDAIQQLNEVTQQNAAASEEIATSAEELSAQADRLIEAQSFFKLNEQDQQFTSQQHTTPPIKKKIPQTVTTGKKTDNGVKIDLDKPDELDEGYERF